MGFLSLLGGAAGGFGMDNNSSVAQSTPFYNDSGIYFNSPGAGTITAGPTTADATTDPSRQNTGGIQALPASTLSTGGLFAPGSPVPYIVGAVLVIFVIIFAIFKKH